MKIYPAVDIMDGKAVRLLRGEKEKKKIYGDPVEIANDFSEHVNKLHIVDLDGAFECEPRNLDVIKKIIEDTGVKIQLGGGLRDIEYISKAYSIGVDHAIIGTNALDLEFIDELTQKFEGITISLDSKDGKVMIDGWEEEKDVTIERAYEMLRDRVKRFVYTSTGKDGALEGVEEIERFWDEEEFIYAGGVTYLRDLELLGRIGFDGVIIGKALYEDKLDLDEVKKKVGDMDVC